MGLRPQGGEIPMPNLIRASGLMLTEFSTIRVAQTLGEAMAALRDAQERSGLPNALMVVDDDGKFCGMLTAKLLIRTLVGTGDTDDESLLGSALLQLNEPVSKGLLVDVPVVAPQDRLLAVIRRGMATRFDFVPVVDDGRPVGLVPVTAIFQAAATLALTPEHEGIRFDR